MILEVNSCFHVPEAKDGHKNEAECFNADVSLSHDKWVWMDEDVGSNRLLVHRRV